MAVQVKELAEASIDTCSKCGGAIMCIDSRVNTTGSYRRRRHRCRSRKCFDAFTTKEIDPH